jgi:7-cyano-7-deazaguanine tRNA-ribosyltransferase
MVSAYEFFRSEATRERAEKRGLHELLDFDGRVMLDSGGYQFLRGKPIRYTARELAEFAKETGADYVISLDFPPRSPQTNLNRLAQKNVDNYKAMVRVLDNVIPVVHAPLRLAELELDRLGSPDPSYLAIGGLVPSSRGAIRQTVDTIRYVNSRLTIPRLHLLGFGAPNVSRTTNMRFHSVDYAGWRNAAAVGYVLLPSGYRKITDGNKLGHAPRPSQKDKSVIESVCRRLHMTPGHLRRDFASRAVLSAFVASRMIYNAP